MMGYDGEMRGLGRRGERKEQRYLSEHGLGV